MDTHETDAGIVESHKEQEVRMREMNPVNWRLPPVAKAPCVKLKDGTVLPWTDGFAERPDLCVACDANGNTDPRAWGGTVTSEPAVAPLEINDEVLTREQGDINAPDIRGAVKTLGIDPGDAQDFTEPTTRNDALTLPEQTDPRLTVDDVVNAVFAKARKKKTV